MIQRIGRMLSSVWGGALPASAMFLGALMAAGPASGQCSISNGPNSLFQGANWPAGFSAGYTYDTIAFAGGTRLFANANFGFGIYDISVNPVAPPNLGWISLPTLLGFHCGDGQSDVASSAVSADGNRLLISLSGAASCHGNTLVFVPGTGLYQIKGDFSPPKAQVAVQQVGSRYIGYALPPTSFGGNLSAADITNPPGWVLTPDSPSPSMGNINSEQNASFPGGGRFMLADNYLFYLSGSSIRVIDARNPGPAGSITTGFSSVDVPFSAWGRSAGEAIGAFGAAVDPASATRIYIVAEFRNSSSNSTGFTLLKLEGGSTTVVGTFLPTPPYSGPNSYPGDGVSLQADPSTGDINILMWAKSRALSPTPAQYVLYSTSVIGWALGSAPLASSPIDGTVFGGGKMSVFKRSGTETDLYTADGSNAWAMQLGCTPPNSPAAASLKVEPVPCPGGAGSCPLADGATVFLGDTLKISPSVSPPDAFKPITGWRLDYDFHAGSSEDAGASYPRLAQADASGSGNPAASYTLVGPCDPTAGGSPASGAGCWNSVQTNSSTGGPDFTTATPAAGATKVLQIAFEASNALGSANKAVQNLTWKVPTVRLATPAILAGGAIQDGSDGHPSATGYKWYFGAGTTSPPGETLTLDASCTGSTCTHSFPGPGTYNVWLTVPYPNGYTTPDCGNPCLAPAAGVTVKVTEVVPKLKVGGLTTPPTIIPYAAGQVTIDDAGTQKAGGIVIDHYQWCTVVAPAACDPATYTTQRFNSLPAQIALPPINNYNLFVKVYYTGGTASPVDWSPNDPSASDPKAWRLNVVSAPPQIAFVSGVQPCFVGCSDVYTNVGTAVTAKVVVGGIDAGSPASSWSIVPSSGVNPSSGSGATFSFTPTSAKDFQLTLTDNGQNAQRTITALNPNPLGVSVGANPNPVAPNSSVSFFASGTGGTGTYTDYSWNFGDGQGGNGQSVNHAYANAGSYAARCTVTDSSGATASRTVTITVSSGGGGGPGAGSVNFNVLLNGSPAGGGSTDTGFLAPAGSTLTFVAFATYGSYDWDFGDGTAHSNLPSPTHVYNSGGTFTIRLTTDTGYRTASITITGGGIGTPEFTLTDVATAASIPLVNGSFTVFSGQQVRFTPVDAANGNQVFAGAVSWSFGDPAGSTSSSNPALFTYNVVADTTFTVQLTATVGSKSVQHAVNVVRPVTGTYTFLYLDGSAPNVSKVDAGRPLAFTATESWADLYDWDFGDGTPHGTAASVIHAFPTIGTFTVTLRAIRLGRTVTTPSPTVFSVQQAPLWVIPGLASVKQGQLPGSSYVSDVVINNPSSSAARYQIAILDGKPLEWKAYTFFPNQTTLFDNIIGKWFQRPDGAYAVLVKGDDSNPTPPVISATTYNNNQGNLAKGTYGVALPVLRTSSALSAGIPSLASSLAGLRDVPKAPDTQALGLLTAWPNVSAAYTNIGLVNTGTETATVEVRFKTTTGDPLGADLGTSFTTFVAPNQTVQFTRPLQNKAGVDVSTSPVASYLFSVNIASGAGVVPYASVSDIGSSDPVFVSPRPSGPLSSTYRVPGVVRAAGANGTFFKSRFVLYNPSTSTATRSVSLTYSFRACNATTGDCLSRLQSQNTETLRAGETKTWEDFIAEWVTADPELLTLNFVSSWIDVAPADGNTDPLVVRADTYNNQVSGNFGTQVPGFVPAQDGASSAGPNKRLVIPRVVQSADPKTGYRTNLSFFLLSGTTATAKVTFYRKNGTPLSIDPLYFTLTGDNALFQLNSSNAFWNQIVADDKAAGLSVVVEAVDGVVGAYSSQVDNVSGDQTLVPGAPLP
jgi:PKD repeat protein